MECKNEVEVRPDVELKAPRTNAVEGSEDPNELVVLALLEKTADKYASLLYEEIVCMRCYDYEGTQYVVFEVRLTPAA
jgi:hypothetical protein